MGAASAASSFGAHFERETVALSAGMKDRGRKVGEAAARPINEKHKSGMTGQDQRACRPRTGGLWRSAVISSASIATALV